MEQDLADELDAEYCPQILDGQVTFPRLQLTAASAACAPELIYVARKLASRVLRSIQGDLLQSQIEHDRFSTQKLVEQALPVVNSCGGTKRSLLVTSGGFNPNPIVGEIASIDGHEPTVLREGVDDYLLCYESGELPLGNVANSLIQHRTDLIETARRLRTRVNIEL